MLLFTRLLKVGYLLALSLAVYLLVSANPSQAQNRFGVSTGYRASPGMPTIAIALPNVSGGGIGGAVGGGAAGFGGGVGGGAAGVSFNSQPIIMTLNLGQFFPNNGQIIGLPPPTLMLPLNNFGYLPILGGLGGFIPNVLNPFTSDSTGAPWAILTALGLGGGLGAGGGAMGGGGLGGGGIAGGGQGGFGGGMGGFGGGQGGIGGMGGGGMGGGFAGKGMGGFNGRKAL